MKLIKIIPFLILCCVLFNHETRAQRNPNNPYDRIGEQHNFALDAFFTEQSKESIKGQLSIETLTNFLCSKLKEVDCNSIRQVLGTSLYSDIKGKSLTESETILIGGGYVTARHGYYVQQINDIIEQHIQEDYSVCYKEILTLEDQVMNDPQLAEAEKSNLLYAASVARYSTKFWKDVFSGIVRYPSLGNPGTDKANASPLPEMSKSDVKGAVSGGAVGGGPGALVGGVGSSIGSAIESFWNSIW